MSLIVPPKGEKIEIAFVDLDGTTETALMGELLQLSMKDSEHMKVSFMTQEEAEQGIRQDELSAYIVLPEKFTKHLYKGKGVTLPVVGNPKRASESLIVLELIDSLTRYIESAQANILTVYSYVLDMNLTAQQEKQIVLEQFIDFTLYSLGKSNILKEEVLENEASTSPKWYYMLACIFSMLTIWLVGFYILLRKEEHHAMEIRLKLLGVTPLQKTTAKIIVAFMSSLIFAIPTFFIFMQYVGYDFFVLDYVRVFLFVSLYAMLVLIGVAIIDLLVASLKVSLLVQMVFVLVFILVSGSFIPTIYFPLMLQNVLPWLFPNEVFNWLVDIILKERNYANYTVLVSMLAVEAVVFVSVTNLYARWRT